MKFKTKDLEYLYNNLKNGDFFAFYKRPWYYAFARLILFVTGQPISHVAGVFDVKRTSHGISFRIGEQLVGHDEKVVDDYVLCKLHNERYIIDSRFENKNIDFYLLPNTHTLTVKQNKGLRDYWNSPGGYDLKELIYTQNWLFKLIGKKSKEYDHTCSGSVRQSMVEVGIEPAKIDDKAPTPAEFIRFSYIKEIIKIEV